MLAHGRKNSLEGLWLSLLVWISAALVFGIFFATLWETFYKGFSGLSPSFLLEAPAKSGRAGGINSIIVSTLLTLGVCFMAAIPLGLCSALFLAEFCPRANLFGRAVRGSVEVLSGVPSIVFGLFGNAFFSKALGLGFSIWSGGLTLACMTLPLFVRLSEEAIRRVPSDLRLGGFALGLGHLRVIGTILLPVAAPGLVGAFLLSLGRAVAETAALVFTSGYVDRMPESLMDSGRALSVHIFDLAMNVPGGDSNAHRSAFVLMSLVLLVNVFALGIAGRWNRRLGAA